MIVGFVLRNPKYAVQNVRQLPAVRKAMREFAKTHTHSVIWPYRTKYLDVAHKQLVSNHPELAADQSNMAMLTRKPPEHLMFNHLGNFKLENACFDEMVAMINTACGESPACKSWIEINPFEIGKTWIVPETFTVASRHGKTLTVPKGFKHDRYTFAPNLGDNRPAIAHDRAYRWQIWDDGTMIGFWEANELLLDLMRQSTDARTRRWAWTYYIGVCIGAWPTWLLSDGGKE